jgi:hypothetical protein
MAWTSISASRYDQDSPEDEDLWGDLIANAEYNYDHAVRGGTHGAAVRLALGRGEVSFSATTCGANKEFTGTVTFATPGATYDGDPNFNSAPLITYGLKEVTDATYEAWTTANSIYGISVITTAVSTSAFSYRIKFYNGGNPDLSGVMYWMAMSPVVAGE